MQREGNRPGTNVDPKFKLPIVPLSEGLSFSTSKTLKSILEESDATLTPTELLHKMKQERRRDLMTCRTVAERKDSFTLSSRLSPGREEYVPPAFDAEASLALAKAIKTFNEKAEKGIEELLEARLVSRDVLEIANFLLDTEGLSRKQMGAYLGGPAEFNRNVLELFVQQFSFDNLELDDAMRVFFVSFALPGEAQIIERIMEAFSKHYSNCNRSTALGNSENTFVLAFALVMLNTDLHTTEVRTKMTRDQFVKNYEGVAASEEDKIPKELLVLLYDRIKRSELKLMSDESEHLSLFLRPERQGWLTKEGGRAKTWKRRWFILKTNMLFYFQDPQDGAPLGTIPLTDIKIRAYPGRPFAFELCATSGGRITSSKRNGDGVLVAGQHDRFVCAADSGDECSTWIRKLNQSILITTSHGSDSLPQGYSSGRMSGGDHV